MRKRRKGSSAPDNRLDCVPERKKQRQGASNETEPFASGSNLDDECIRYALKVEVSLGSLIPNQLVTRNIQQYSMK